MEGRCVSFGRSIAFHPLIDLLKRTFGIEDGDAGQTAADRIDRGVRRLVGVVADTVPYLCALLSIDSGEAVSALDPQTRRGETLAALRRVIQLSAQARPLVLVFEDLHWSDVASEDLLIGIANSLPGQRVLAVFSYRPGYERWRSPARASLPTSPGTGHHPDADGLAARPRGQSGCAV